MRFTIKLTVFLLAALTTLSSCVSSKKFNELMGEKEALAKSLAESQEAIKVLEEEKVNLMADNDKMASDIEAIKADLATTKGEIDKVKAMVDAKEAELSKLKGEVEGAFADYAAAGLEVSADDENLYISMSDKVLFRSGSAGLDKNDKEVIAKLSDILKANPDISVLVEGHTDNAQIIGGPYRDNWDLSVARSTAVVRQLIKDGVDSGQVTAAGAGELRPAVTEDPSSKESRAANRRTEFILSPNVAKLYDLVK